jgi:hypothetical protein
VYSESDITGLLTGLTSYSIELTKPKEVELPEGSVSPRILVAYADIVSKNPTAPIEHDLYDLHGEDLIQRFSVQFICNRSDLPDVWRDVYAALIGKNPQPLEVTRSGLSLQESFPRGFSNTVVHWHSTWIIGFPTLFQIV